MSDLILVVPVYNEANRLDPAPWLEFLAADRSRALCFVDDGSRDGSVGVLESLRAAAPDQVSVHQLPENRGKAEAVRIGMTRALQQTARYAGFIDADLAAPLSQVSLLQSELDDYPAAWAAFGSRVKLLGRHIVRSERRHYLGRVFATGASLALGLPVYDTQCGLKLFRPGPEVRDALMTPFRSRWAFDVELLERLAGKAGTELHQRIHEVPLREWADPGGTKLRLHDLLRMPFQLAVTRWRRPR